MSLNHYWQRICQSIGKSIKMNQENTAEYNEDNLDENLNEATEQAGFEKDKDQNSALAEQVAELKDRNLRLFAEFENFRKRTNKEKQDLVVVANEGLLRDLLPVLDDFGRGMVEIEKSSDENLIKGVELIQNKLVNTLKNKGLQVMEIQVGDAFDVETMEAITQIAAPSPELVGKVVDVVETGYTLKDKVIRYAKVVVGK